jgi:hypothetical protein
MVADRKQNAYARPGVSLEGKLTPQLLEIIGKKNRKLW